MNVHVAGAYLDKLNAEQRRAVEHGHGAFDTTPALLIIAGAGSGKTNTLAHRVAHLIVNGADPRRMMLLTFSRRAAAEMQRRIERIATQAFGPKAGVMTDALWPGPAPFTPSAPDWCANTRSILGLRANSPSTTARIPPT